MGEWEFTNLSTTTNPKEIVTLKSNKAKANIVLLLWRRTNDILEHTEHDSTERRPSQ